MKEFAYRETETDKTLGYLRMLPFYRDDMIRLFEAVGFTLREMFSDLTPGYNTTADFYTYAFVRI
jgi:hypothetical protein